MTRLRHASLTSLVLLSGTSALAQEGDSVTVEQAPIVDEATTTTTVMTPYGVPQPGTDLNSHLPSSSRPIIGDQSDTFDLNRPSAEGQIVFTNPSGGQGAYTLGEGGQYANDRKAVVVPEIHTVRQGDTLWDLSGHYYANPWAWPQVWSLNPQVANPHWIYPGDELRMREPTAATVFPEDNSAAGGGLVGRAALVPPKTIFLRDQGYIGDPERDVWGELVGSREDQMLLGFGNTVYLQMKEGAKVNVGQQLTVFQPVRQPQNVPGARKPPGEIVKVYGTVRVTDWDPDTRVARAEITESVDVIERGAKVGPVGRRFDVVPPKENDEDVVARILTSMYPNIFMGRYQIVFLDRGSDDGLEPGNRLKVVRQGDVWRRNLEDTSDMARARLRMDSPERVPVEKTPLHGDDRDFPEEVVGEVQVLRTERFSSLAMVTRSSRELIPGDRAVAVAGY